MNVFDRTVKVASNARAGKTMGKWRRLINLYRYQLRTLRTVDVKPRFYNSWLRISGFGMGRSKCTCYPSYSLREKNLLSIDRSSLPYLSRLVTLQIFKSRWWVHSQLHVVSLRTSFDRAGGILSDGPLIYSLTPVSVLSLACCVRRMHSLCSVRRGASSLRFASCLVEVNAPNPGIPC